MALNAKNAAGGASGGNTPPLEAGTYPGRLVHVVDCGVQNQRPYQGKPKPPAQEILLTYELVDEFMLDEDGKELQDKPRHVSESFVFYNLEADKAKSTARYKAIDPKIEKGGEWGELVGTPVNVTIVQNPGKGKNEGKVFANIASISPMRPKDAERTPDLITPAIVFDLDEPNLEDFMKLPDWVRKKVAGNLNFEGSELEKLIGAADPPANDAEPAEDAAPTADDEDPDEPY